MNQAKEYHREAHCQNCNMPLIGDYCANCGQKANFHKDSFAHLAAHFAGDYFHYDGKFWITVKTLFTKPGYITKNYLSGKRATYLNPIQLYIFISTVFFLFFFGLNHKDKNIVEKQNSDINSIDTLQKNTAFSYWSKPYHSLKEYNRKQQLLPNALKDNWFKQKIIQQDLKVKTMDNFNEKLNEINRHNFPKMFFVLMPFFALLLYWIFRKNDLFFIDHLIFSIHFHSVIFIIWSVNCVIQFINIRLENISQFIFILGISIYLYLSLRTVYGNSAIKTLGKEFLLSILYSIGFLIFLAVFVLISLLLL